MRAIWKGSISFGLVNIPVNLYSGSKEREIKFVLLHNKDHSEIRYAKICKAEEKEIDYKDIVKGFETESGKYVVLTDEDFKEANIEKSKTIEIVGFTDEKEIDIVYYEKPYYLEPGKGAGKAYVLLIEALKKSKKVAIAKYVLKNHERYGIIKPYENALILDQIRFQSELIELDALKLPAKEKITAKEMGMALQLVQHLAEKFSPQNYKDTYVEDLKEIIRQKEKTGKVKAIGTERKPSKVHDIMSLLQASLEEEKPKKETKKKAIHRKKA